MCVVVDHTAIAKEGGEWEQGYRGIGLPGAEGVELGKAREREEGEGVIGVDGFG